MQVTVSDGKMGATEERVLFDRCFHAFHAPNANEEAAPSLLCLLLLTRC
jgi:hypothetical protein